MTKIPEGKSLILYDGVCALCNGFVNWILNADSNGQFVFLPLQSDSAKDLLRAYGIPDTLESIVLIDEGGAFTRSEAIFRISRSLERPAAWVGFWSFLPRVIADGLYRLIAATRYKTFGKYDTCPLPRPEHRSRFLS